MNFSVVATETPKKANIRPMATTVTSVRPTTPISHSSAAAKVTASIRPMAIAPTSVPSASTSTSTTSGMTPTATVMPTTVTQQEVVEGLLLFEEKIMQKNYKQKINMESAWGGKLKCIISLIFMGLLLKL